MNRPEDVVEGTDQPESPDIRWSRVAPGLLTGEASSPAGSIKISLEHRKKFGVWEYSIRYPDGTTRRGDSKHLVPAKMTCGYFISMDAEHWKDVPGGTSSTGGSV